MGIKFCGGSSRVVGGAESVRPAEVAVGENHESPAPASANTEGVPPAAPGESLAALAEEGKRIALRIDKTEAKAAKKLDKEINLTLKKNERLIRRTDKKLERQNARVSRVLDDQGKRIADINQQFNAAFDDPDVSAELEQLMREVALDDDFADHH